VLASFWSFNQALTLYHQAMQQQTGKMRKSSVAALPRIVGALIACIRYLEPHEIAQAAEKSAVAGMCAQ
jgi:hypothetical protein